MDHPLPTCCQTCRFHGSEWNEWSDTIAWFCDRHVFFPTKKKTCKVKDADTARRGRLRDGLCKAWVLNEEQHEEVG